jgi:hypothetical protein
MNSPAESRTVTDICKNLLYDPAAELQALLDEHPGLDVNIPENDDSDDEYNGYDVGAQALHLVSTRGHTGSMRVLLDHGADVHARDSGNFTPLMCATACGFPECVQMLIEAKSDVNAMDPDVSVSVVHIACANGSESEHPECLQLLIDNGGDVYAKDYTGRTPLLTACGVPWGWRGTVETLLRAKADVHARNADGWSALHCATRARGDPECMQLLIDKGLDVNARDNHGCTAAIYACSDDYVRSLKRLQVLVDNKADLSLQNNQGESALHCAIVHQHPKKDINFALLCCNTDTQGYIEERNHVRVAYAAATEDYKHVQAYIDEFHGILNNTLSTEVIVDLRFGLGGYGIYQEPLERTLEYLGLSMNKDQVVNASIDGEEGVKRALIPFHTLSADGWRSQLLRETAA